MLCLTRFVGESVSLYVDGKPIGSIKVYDIRDDNGVRLAFNIPDHVRVIRTEKDDGNGSRENHRGGLATGSAEVQPDGRVAGSAV